MITELRASANCTTARRLARWVALPALGLALAASPAYAGVHRHVDPASGMEVLSNVAPPTPAPVAAAALPATVRTGTQVAARTDPAATGFPMVARERQSELDAGRRAILQDELLSEQKALQHARELRAAAEVLHRHRMNVEALTRELAGVR